MEGGRLNKHVPMKTSKYVLNRASLANWRNGIDQKFDGCFSDRIFSRSGFPLSQSNRFPLIQSQYSGCKVGTGEHYDLI